MKCTNRIVLNAINASYGHHDDRGPWIGATLFYDGDRFSTWKYDTDNQYIVGVVSGVKVRVQVLDENLTWK